MAYSKRLERNPFLASPPRCHCPKGRRKPMANGTHCAWCGWMLPKYLKRKGGA